MPLRLHHLTTDRRTCTLDIDGEQLRLTYRPSGYTPAVEEELRAAEAADLDAEGRRQWHTRPVITMLAGLLVEWDLLDDKDRPLPVRPDTLRALPLAFLARVLQRIVEDMQPGEARAASSATS